jgi:hypothetical protein
MNANRRTAARHPARLSIGRLEWAEAGDFRSARFRLRDVSRTGAGLVAEAPLPLNRPVWIRLEEPVSTDWLAARVTRQGVQLEAGVLFSGPCPFEFLAAATMGIGFGSLN